ncbi:hypothetical protein DL768_010558 [Monosporascus sp. mg162]|nr:hypothetical protein DL768_010558 [Monosporascus sp. mg162]
MCLPVSVADFFTLAKHCLELGQRIHSLGDDHRHLKARAEVLSVVCGQLHEALIKFDNIPKEKARKFALAVHNSVDDLKGELRDQFVILSLMVLRLNQYAAR